MRFVFRIVAAGNPRVAAGAERQRQIAPRVAAGLAGTSDRRRAPQLLARVAASCAADEADVVFVARASGHARDHFPANDDRDPTCTRSRGCRRPWSSHTSLPVRASSATMCASLVVPKILSPKIAMFRWMPRPVSPPPVAELWTGAECRSAHRPSVARRGAGGGVSSGAILPDQIAGCGIERLNDAARIRQIHDAVVDERRSACCAPVSSIAHDHAS